MSEKSTAQTAKGKEKVEFFLPSKVLEKLDAIANVTECTTSEIAAAFLTWAMSDVKMDAKVLAYFKKTPPKKRARTRIPQYR